MIIKRITAALRRQDWAAVAIEFLLVVLGVLIAFQISEWGSEREARMDRAAATERLLAETEDAVAYFRAGVQTQTRTIDDLDYALANLQRGTWQSADQARMTLGLQRIINAAAPAPPSSVYDDLVSSGKLGRIGDAKLRAAIASYRATMEFNGRYVSYLQLKMPAFDRYPALHYVFAPSAGRRTKLEVDFPALAHDRELQEELALAADAQLLLLQIRQRTLQDVEKACIEIGRVADHPCNLHRPVPTF